MRFEIVGKNISVTEGMRTKIEEKLGFLDKYILIDPNVIARDIPILNRYVNDLDSNSIYFGKYTFVTNSLLFIINLTLPVIIRLKNSHNVKPINTNDAKYGVLLGNITPNTNV